MSGGQAVGPNSGGTLPPAVQQRIVELGSASLEGVVEPERREEIVLRVLSALPLAATPVSEMQITATQHVGPVPAPETIEHYDRILPGSADRMLAMAERDQAAFIASSTRRQWMDFWFKVLCVVLGVVGLGGILAAVVWLAQRDHDVLAGTVVTALGAVVAVIVNARMGKPEPLATN